MNDLLGVVAMTTQAIPKRARKTTRRAPSTEMSRDKQAQQLSSSDGRRSGRGASVRPGPRRDLRRFRGTFSPEKDVFGLPDMDRKLIASEASRGEEMSSFWGKGARSWERAPSPDFVATTNLHGRMVQVISVRFPSGRCQTPGRRPPNSWAVGK